MALAAAYQGGNSTGRRGWWIELAAGGDLQRRVDLEAALETEIPRYDREQADGRWWIALESERALLRLIPELAAYKAQGSLL